jgi:hypothetical protein
MLRPKLLRKSAHGVLLLSTYIHNFPSNSETTYANIEFLPGYGFENKGIKISTLVCILIPTYLGMKPLLWHENSYLGMKTPTRA